MGEIMNSSKMSLKPRIAFAVRRLELQIMKLEQAADRFLQRDKALFARVIDAQTKHDKSREKVYSNELLEVRKMECLIISAKLALEEITLRLRKVVELRDAVSTLGTAVIALQSVMRELVSIFPEAENELGEIGNMLSGVMVEAGHISAAILDFSTVSLEAQLLVSEAETAAEQRIKEKCPGIPSA